MSDIDLQSKFGFTDPVSMEESKAELNAQDQTDDSHSKEESKGGQADLLNQMIGVNDNEEMAFHIKEEDIAEVIDDIDVDDADEPKQMPSIHDPSKIEIKQEMQETFNSIKKEEINESYEELQERYKKMKEESNGRVNDQMVKAKIEHLKKMREKRIQERWMRALMHFGVEPELYYQDKEKIMKVYPFSDFSFVRAKKGEFNKAKMSQIVLELCKFEIINDTYNVECKVGSIFNILGHHRRNHARDIPFELQR